MNFQDSVKTCLTKYIDFAGRASKSEFWWFVLAVTIVNIIAYLINHSLYMITSLVFLLPYLAVLVRRLHDTDRVGWWALLLLIPLIGPIILIIFAIMDGTAGANRFGPPVTA